jgi:Swi5-dependent recombination DNA repair protein 1
MAHSPTTDAALRQRKKELEGQVKQVRQQLELARQAQRIQASSLKLCPGEDIDNELKDLIQKWRGASRLAAEELFDLIKARVDRYEAFKLY